jgi:mannose-6-phosphate isomerase-like protein (cupin superfamily)
MTPSYTIKNLRDVKDSAPDFGMAEVQEAHFAHGELDASDTGLSFHAVKANQRQAFGHKHENAEEVYVVLGGSGRVKLDDEVREVQELDAIRVSPAVIRAFEAGPDGLEVLAFGPRREGDGELLPGWWA